MQMTSMSKRPISASVPQTQFSRHTLCQQRKQREQVCHSQNLNNSEVSRATKKLPLLLMKLKLQELGFRDFDYNPHVNRLEDVDINNIAAITLDIVNSILSQQKAQTQIRIHQQSRQSSRSQERNINVTQEQRKSVDKFICPVCFQECQHQQFVTLECGHRFCKQCLGGHIKNSIDQAKYEIPCLEFQCESKIQDDNIKRLISESLYKRYHHFKRKKQIERNPNNKFCSVPNCEGILEQQQGFYLCPECKADYCLNCIRPKHEGDCSTRIQQIIDRSYQDYNIKKCPSCRAPIQKMDGCNHMSCKNCMHQFCWLCLGKYTKYHYRYFNCCGCPGMQFQNQQDRCCERLKQLCVWMILPPILLLIILTIVTVLPFYLVAMMFIKPIQKAMQFECLSNCCGCSCHSCVDCCDQDDSDCQCCTECASQNSINVAHFFVGLLMFPYGILYGITIAPIKFFMHVYEFVGELLQ